MLNSQRWKINIQILKPILFLVFVSCNFNTVAQEENLIDTIANKSKTTLSINAYLDVFMPMILINQRVIGFPIWLIITDIMNLT